MKAGQEGGSVWTDLGRMPPTALVRARHFAHAAAQWATKAARANLTAVADDSHSSLAWDGQVGALVSQPLSGRGGELTIGVRIAPLHLIALQKGRAPSEFSLDGQTDSAVGAWVDSVLKAAGLAPASSVSLPYTIAGHAGGNGSHYEVRGEAKALEELARWFSTASETLEVVRTALTALSPGPTPVRCWPHHFDIATLVRLEDGDSEHARAVGIGVSPGDELYSQPYAYISPWPPLKATNLPSPPAPGHWQIQGFVGVVATGEAIVALQDRQQGLRRFFLEAFEICRAQLGT